MDESDRPVNYPAHTNPCFDVFCSKICMLHIKALSKSACCILQQSCNASQETVNGCTIPLFASNARHDLQGSNIPPLRLLSLDNNWQLATAAIKRTQAEEGERALLTSAWGLSNLRWNVEVATLRICCRWQSGWRAQSLRHWKLATGQATCTPKD